jgi:prepilin-type N-terminal cleavage/methylation domain-containing protein/prepilin-type processing-associated H-X9-DG protein
MSIDTSCGLLNAKRRPTNGFTLVELLVVIGIIALLISILLPALTRARQQASLVQCQSNLRQMGQAIIMYAGDNQGMLPFGFWGGGPAPNYDGETVWSVLIQPYISKGGSTFGDNYSTGGLQSAIRKLFQCPDAPGAQAVTDTNTYTQYVCHPRLMPWISDAPAGWTGPNNPDPVTGKAPTPYKLAHIKRSSEIGLIFDASLVQNAQGGWNVPSTVPVGTDLDGGLLAPNNSDPGAIATTHLTDQYSYSGNTGTVVVGPYGATTNSGGLNPGQPVNLAAGSSGPYLTHPPNLDVQYNGGNTGPPYGSGNIRFRHLGNTQGPVLMVDGHVQVFNYNPRTWMTDMLRSNINVNP